MFEAHLHEFSFTVLPLTELKFNPDFAKWLIRENDVVHCLTQSGFDRLNRMLPNPPHPRPILISTIHHIVEEAQVVRALQADRILTVCERYRKQLRKMGVLSNRLFLMHNGVDTQTFQVDDSVHETSFGFPEGTPVIGFAGKASSDHDGRKGIDRMLNLLHAIDANTEKKIGFLTVGPGWKERIGNDKFENIQAEHLGFVSNDVLPEFFNAIDIYICTARVEGGPVPVLEAMACGTTVATSDVGMIPELIEDGHNGIVLNFDTELSDEACRILELLNNPKQLSKLGDLARRTVVDRFQWSQVAVNLRSLYAVGEPQPPPFGAVKPRRVTESLLVRDRSRSLLGKRSKRPAVITPASDLPWNDRVVTFIQNSMRTGESGLMRSTPLSGATAYGTAYCLQTLLYLNDPNWKQSINRDFVRVWQDPDTGLLWGPELDVCAPEYAMHDREHLVLHSTCTLLPFCQELGVELKPLTAAHRFLDSEYLADWCVRRDWENAWFEGNNILFVGQLLVYLRDVEAQPKALSALEQWFAWLDREMDSASSLWGTNGRCSDAAAVYGGYHQMLVYWHEHRSPKNIRGLVDTVLALQHPDGGFNPQGNAGACEDVDCVDLLVHCYKREDYRRAEIRCALQRCVDHILKTQNPDGGFPYKRNAAQSHMGIPGTEAPANVSCAFPTWFRVHTLALCAEVIPNHPKLCEINFRFNRFLGMGWHRGPPDWKLNLPAEQLHAEKAIAARVCRANKIAAFERGIAIVPRAARHFRKQIARLKH
ncbi:MAG: glycosyltransferase [Verrucomicrobia bacterium]|nr:glycosyltransferase [Verrucomicrobiota bacterium]